MKRDKLNYYFISDNQFFLYGLSSIVTGRYENLYFINLNEINYITFPISPEIGDIIVLMTSNCKWRTRILNMVGSMRCRLLVMVSLPLSVTYTGGTICLISSRLTVQKMLIHLDRIAFASITPGRIPNHLMRMFNQLCCGTSIANLIGIAPGLSIKSLYRIKRQTLSHYGLNECNVM